MSLKASSVTFQNLVDGKGYQTVQHKDVVSQQKTFNMVSPSNRTGPWNLPAVSCCLWATCRISRSVCSWTAILSRCERLRRRPSCMPNRNNEYKIGQIHCTLSERRRTMLDLKSSKKTSWREELLMRKKLCWLPRDGRRSSREPTSSYMKITIR